MTKTEQAEKDERAARLRKLENFAKAGREAYPAETARTHAIREALTLAHDEEATISGRVMAKRTFGKLTFVKLMDESGQMQIMLKSDELPAEEYEFFVDNVDLGDIVEFAGTRMVTKKGEESLLAKNWRMLNKTLRPLPEKYHGLQDKEVRFRKRYLDLIANREVFELFKTRSRIITLVRTFLNERGFLEVETPILQPLYGGTNARPFETYINAYKMKMYLRVAPELYLKRLLVGGYEKIYELGKNFRNEGVDATHNPEFTMLEWYEAYADYHAMMDRAESLYKFIARELFGEEKIKLGKKEIDLSHSWPRVKMTEAIREKVGLEVEKMSDEELAAHCRENKLNIRGQATRGQMIMEIFERQVTPKLISPTWIIDYPREVSPLARTHRRDESLVERFECYIMGKEIGDGWTEIIDPQMQRSRFENEQKSMKGGDDEAHPMDEDFLEALEYGMPPTGGIGIGIDRLTMLFTDKWQIRELLFFPLMKDAEDK